MGYDFRQNQYAMYLSTLKSNPPITSAESHFERRVCFISSCIAFRKSLLMCHSGLRNRNGWGRIGFVLYESATEHLKYLSYMVFLRKRRQYLIIYKPYITIYYLLLLASLNWFENYGNVFCWVRGPVVKCWTRDQGFWVSIPTVLVMCKTRGQAFIP